MKILKGGRNMLCQFTVKNFQCFLNETTLDMQATNLTEHKNSLLTDVDNEVFLPLAAIYGPNGAGKSTILYAFYSLACKIMRPICAVSSNEDKCETNCANITIKPFKFSKSSINQPTSYQLFFRTHLYEYQYDLSVLNEKVVYEELSKKLLEGARYTPVFKRDIKAGIELKGSLKGYSSEGISDNLTLLSYLGITHGRNKIIKDIIDWFQEDVKFLNYSNPKEEVNIAVTERKGIKDMLLKMLQEMDIDIIDYRVEEKEKKLKVFTSHLVEGHKYELDLFEESKGTIKIFGFLPFIADSLVNGKTLVVDELDAKLHPLLLKYIIQLFTNPSVNKHKAQLIFTSHDLSTMNNEIFRRDEIWFVAKGRDLASKMYSLVEFKDDEGKSERKDASYNKRYLQGRYGADPYLRKIIDWEAI